MRMVVLSRKALKILICIVCLTVVGGAVQGLSQGTSLEIEKTEVVKGDTVNLSLNLAEATDGLGRLDATIVTSDPEVLELVSLVPKAVSQEFLQVDVQEENRIKFKLVDLRKRISPGDKGVELLTLTVKGKKEGVTELEIAEIKYTDEEGNLIEPQVKSTEISVISSTPEQKEDPGRTKDEGKESNEEKVDSVDSEQEPGKVDTEPQRDRNLEDTDYEPSIEEIELKLGETGKSRFKVMSLPDGLRMAQVWVTNSGGISFGEISFLEPAYFEVIKRTDRLVNFRFVDFENDFQSGARKVKVAELKVNALKAGNTSLRVKKLEIWTDSGRKVIREGDPVTVTVELGPIGRSKDPPRDLNGDGLYEDINGDGRLTEKDAFILAFNLDSRFIRENTSLFDFDWDGTVSFDDAVKLIQDVK